MSFFLASVFCGLFFDNESSAGTVTLAAKPEFNLTDEGDSVLFSGFYTLKNLGDDGARDVVPTLRLGNWNWTGVAQSVESGSEKKWTLNARALKKQIFCPASSESNVNPIPCAYESSEETAVDGVLLPTRGIFPLVFSRTYFDSNGYQFNAVDVDLVELGRLTEVERLTLKSPNVRVRSNSTGDGETFRIRIEADNGSATILQTLFSIYTSAELQAEPQTQVELLQPTSVIDVDFKVRNKTGLGGSSYITPVVAQWSAHGLSAASITSGLIDVEPLNPFRHLPVLASIGAILTAWLMYLGFYSKRKPN